MSDGDDSKSGRKRIRDGIANLGRHLQPPSFKWKSRSLSPTPAPTSGGKTLYATAIALSLQVRPPASAPPAVGLSTPGHALASSPAASPTSAGHASSPASSTATGKSAASPPTLAQTPPIPPIPLPYTLSPLEIRQRTASLLKKRLTPGEVGKIQWDEATPEQAKAVVEEVHQSLEGMPEHMGTMFKTLQYINKYSTVIDVATQYQPCITALVWAGMRTAVQVGGWLLIPNSYPTESGYCKISVAPLG